MKVNCLDMLTVIKIKTKTSKSNRDKNEEVKKSSSWRDFFE